MYCSTRHCVAAHRHYRKGVTVAGTVKEVTLPKLTTEDGIMRMAVKRHGEYKDFAIVSYRGE